jgi:hypothetical protein
VPDKRSGHPATERPPQTVPTPSTASIVSHQGDQAWRARERLAGERYRLAVARLANQRMPLDHYYRHPTHGFYCVVVEGWMP